MSNAAVVIPFPTAQTSTVDALAARFLRAKRAIKEAEAIIEAIEPELKAALKEEGDSGVMIAGLGVVKLVDVAPQRRLDEKAAIALLEKHGEAVPRKPVGGGAQLRPTLV